MRAGHGADELYELRRTPPTAIEFICRNGHPGVVMRRSEVRHAWVCPRCGNENGMAFLYERFRWAWRLMRKGGMAR